MNFETKKKEFFERLGETCYMVPLQRIALDKEHGKQREDRQRDNLLDNLALPEGKWTAQLGATYAVGGHLKAVLKQCDTPANKHNAYHAVALQLRLESNVSIPCQCHKDI